jgi:hypothetical protein
MTMTPRSPQRDTQLPSQRGPLRTWGGLALTASLLAAGSLTAPAAHSADFSLVGSELRLRTNAQATPTSQLFVTSFPAVATVSETAVEFPDVSSLFDPTVGVPPGFANSLVDVEIDAGADYIEIDFDNAGSIGYATGFQNTYVFSFADAIALQITEATIDPLTTLGLTPDRISFVDNELFVNVQSLDFNPSSFARINLSGTLTPPPDPDPDPSPNPSPDPDPVSVPEPSTLAFLAGAAVLGLGLKRKGNLQTS